MKTLSKLSFILIWSCIFFTACKESDIEEMTEEELSSQKLTSLTELQGTWKLNVTLWGDALELPCYESRGTKDSLSRDITLVLSKDATESSGQKININGQAPINLYTATAEILSYNSTDQEGTLSVSALGSTKIAGSNELLACESRFYKLIETAKNFRVITDKKGQKTLYWGVINKSNSTLLYPGNYLIFEKVK